MASAWGLHRQHVVGVPVSGFGGNGGGCNLSTMIGGSIHNLSCVMPDPSVRRAAGMVPDLLWWSVVGLVSVQGALW